MALDSSTMASVYQSALASIRSLGTGADIGAIARELQSRFGLLLNNPFVDFLNVVRSADSNWRQASVLEADGSAVPRPRDTPIDPTLDRTNGLYQYRVVVVSRDSRGNTEEILVLVDADAPLSGDTARAEAIAQVQSGEQPMSTNPKDGFPSGDVTYSAAIVSAGRAR